MTAPNHALTGALIGLSVANPFIALPLAFVSHFVCDAIPHYDPPTPQGKAALYRSKRFVYEFLVVGAGLCAALVAVLAVTRPQHWLQAAICAFLATSPDLFWIPRFLHAQHASVDMNLNPFLAFHHRIQWKTGPELIWVEVAWFIAFSILLGVRL